MIAAILARITPACAGKSRCYSLAWRYIEDHPRVCGEKHDTFPTLNLDPGSPPRVRGKVAYLLEDNSRDGITPACAGKSRRIVPAVRVGEDHPRVCGEKRYGQNSKRAKEGSPPRVRGKVDDRHRVGQDIGITPACAGKRTTCNFLDNNSQDHPRVCGEKLKILFCTPRMRGSPPRVRGKERP